MKGHQYSSTPTDSSPAMRLLAFVASSSSPSPPPQRLGAHEEGEVQQYHQIEGLFCHYTRRRSPSSATVQASQWR